MDSAYDIILRRKKNYPRRNDEFLDLPRLITDFIDDDSGQVEFSKSTKFFLQGSCFAENLHAELQRAGYDSFHNGVLEAVNSPPANMFYLSEVANKAGAVRDRIQEADVFILTVGVAPCLFLRETDQFVLLPDPKEMGKYYQRTITVQESKEALINCFRAIYSINPNIKIVITLSPVPLGSTFEFHSAIIADCVSKSVLRASIHEALEEFAGKKPTYFPAFEIVRWVGGHTGTAFGEDGLPRHVSKQYVGQIISSFMRHRDSVGKI